MGFGSNGSRRPMGGLGSGSGPAGAGGQLAQRFAQRVQARVPTPPTSYGANNIRAYADGGKVIKDHADEYPQPSFAGAVVDRVKEMVGGGSKPKTATPRADTSAVGAIATAVAPKSITQRKARIDKSIEEAGG